MKEGRKQIPIICFIILNYNGYEETEKLTCSLKAWDTSSLDFHIVVVDNCSTDDSYENLKHKFSGKARVDVIRTEHNGGYSYGNNYGASFAISNYRPDYIAICNPDIELEQEMVIKLLQTFETNEKIGMCAPIMKMLDGHFSIHAQTLPAFKDDLRACSIRSVPLNVIKENYQTIDQAKNLIITEMIPGSFFVVRSDVFSKIGMLDDRVFLYCEERIIGSKMKQAGYLAVTRADLFYIHAHAVTVKKSISTIKSQKLLWQSRLYYQKEYNNVRGISLALLYIRSRIFICELAIILLVKNIITRSHL